LNENLSRGEIEVTEITRHSPMSTLDLLFDGKFYTVPKKHVFELFDRHQAMLEAKSYVVRSSAPVHVFEAFVDSLKRQTKISVTNENAVALSLLAKEFFLPELETECGTFSVSVNHFSSLADRVSQLEGRICSLSNPWARFEEEIQSQKRGLETLRLEVDELKSLKKSITQDANQLEIPLKPVTPVQCSLSSYVQKIVLEQNEAKQLDGIIWYLTK
jgi:phosphatidate phosphatase PAH1